MSEPRKPTEKPGEDEIKREKVRVVPIEYVDDFPDHPFKVKDDEEMQKLVESIREYGVMTPVIARKKPDERYELISGHRRKHASLILGIKQIPIIVRELSREEAIISMVDSNLQRESILPSEKAAAYKMKMEALRRKAGRPSKDNSCPLDTNLFGRRSDEIVAESTDESARQIQRYIRLTELTPELLEKVDEGKIAFRPAVELSYLSEEQQRDLLETIESEDATPSLEQAIRMKKASQEGALDMDAIFTIMTEAKPNQVEKIKISREKLNRYFPPLATPQQIEDTIIKALDLYRREQERRKQRDDRDDR